ncbi:MAG: hypothetical protein AB1585_12420, partial [Thermodesulfobacteriota bacterium]
RDNFKVVDILLVHPLHFENSFKNKIIKKVNQIDIYVASLSDLIKTKRFAGRGQDQSDIEMLKKVKRIMGDKK